MSTAAGDRPGGAAGTHPAATPAARAARRSTARALLAPAGRLVAGSVVVGVCGLVLWSLLPLLLGWHAHVVVGGSMGPLVDPGDVLVSQEVDAALLRPGMVVLFREPGRPDEVVAHRVRSVGTGGELVTRGDANATDDAWRVRPADLVGVARLQVPLVGLPSYWAGSGRWLPLVLTTGGLLLAAAASTGGGRPHHEVPR